MTDDTGKPKARVAEPQRRQCVIRFEMPEDTLAPTHAARVLWNVIGTLDLSAFLVGVEAIDGSVGRKTLYADRPHQQARVGVPVPVPVPVEVKVKVKVKAHVRARADTLEPLFDGS